MHKKPDLEQLLEQALKMATDETRYRFVACYLRAALETAQESQEIRESSWTIGTEQKGCRASPAAFLLH